MTPTARSGADGADYHQLIDTMLVEAREEVSRADSKASILLALYMGLQVVLLSSLASGTWSPTELSGWCELAFWLGWLIALWGLLTIGSAVYPRVENPHAECVTYFGHVAACESIGDMRVGLEETAKGEVSRGEEQLWTVSRIVRRKYSLIRRSMLFTLVGATVGGAAVVVSSLLNG